jgi:putative membrane protein
VLPVEEVGGMVVSLLVRWALLALTVVLTAWILPGVTLEGGVLSAFWVALLIALVNVLAQAGLRVMPKPDAFLLLAVLVLAVNGLVVWLVARLTDSLTVDGFLDGVFAAVLISLISLTLSAVALRLLANDGGAKVAPGG